jgi:hypothetical protein
MVNSTDCTGEDNCPFCNFTNGMKVRLEKEWHELRKQRNRTIGHGRRGRIQINMDDIVKQLGYTPEIPKDERL